MRSNLRTNLRLATGWLAIALLVAVAAGRSARADVVTVEVTVTNLSPSDGTYLTPFWVGFHDGTFDFVDVGSTASISLERLAEDGNTGSLSADFAASGLGATDATLGSGPIAPGSSVSQTFMLDSGSPMARYLSYAAMVIPSNDAFVANDSPTEHAIFDASGNFLPTTFLILGTDVLDAGTEVNTENATDTAFLGQSAPNTGTPENSVVRPHPGFEPNGRILQNFPGADFLASGYQIARVEVRLVPEPATIALLPLGGLILLAGRRALRRGSCRQP